jgi:Protein of unknown function (DUF3551)
MENVPNPLVKVKGTAPGTIIPANRCARTVSRGLNSQNSLGFQNSGHARTKPEARRARRSMRQTACVRRQRYHGSVIGPAPIRMSKPRCGVNVMRSPREVTMGKFLLVAVASAAGFLLGTQPSQAYYGNAPWCAVVSVGNGSSVARCVYWSFEACRPNVIAGNRGFCNTNPYYAGQFAASPQPRLVRKRVRR